MSPMLPPTIDHVAIAVRDRDAACQRWCDRLGAGLAGRSDHPTFRTEQVHFANGGRLELLRPPAAGGGFVADYLDRFGTGVHHVTLKVADLAAAIASIGAAGLGVVDVDRSDPTWQEAFVRPSHVGGLIVQLAESPYTPSEWAERLRLPVEPARDDAASLHGPLLEHDDLDRARHVWTCLGASVTDTPDGLLASWGDAPLTVAVREGPTTRPVGLRMTGTPPLPTDPELGPAVLAPAR